MHPVLNSCRLYLRVLADLLGAVHPNSGLPTASWPQYASKAIAARFRRGIRIVEAYLRRVLILMALEIEPTLVDARRPLFRPKERKWRMPSVRFSVLSGRNIDLDDRARAAFEAADRERRWRRPVPLTGREPVKMGALYRRLDWLKALAANPVRRARRLAVDLARRRPGPIVAPDWRLRLPQRWGTEVSMTYTLLGHKVFELSRSRPPPQPPPQRYGPLATLLEW
jgi:hypothetical protein